MGEKKSGDKGGASGASVPAARDLWRIEPLPDDICGSPLDFLFAEHMRHREAAQIMALIADREEESRPDRREVFAMLRDFLATDLVQHTIDEEEAFFPLLREHCQHQDGIDGLIDRLTSEHAVDRASEGELAPALAQAAETGKLAPAIRRRLRAFSEHLRQHIALENAVLLPIARARLDRAALHLLGERLRALRERT